MFYDKLVGIKYGTLEEAKPLKKTLPPKDEEKKEPPANNSAAVADSAAPATPAMTPSATGAQACTPSEQSSSRQELPSALTSMTDDSDVRGSTAMESASKQSPAVELSTTGDEAIITPAKGDTATATPMDVDESGGSERGPGSSGADEVAPITPATGDPLTTSTAVGVPASGVRKSTAESADGAAVDDATPAPSVRQDGEAMETREDKASTVASMDVTDDLPRPTETSTSTMSAETTKPAATDQATLVTVPTERTHDEAVFTDSTRVETTSASPSTAEAAPEKAASCSEPECAPVEAVAVEAEEAEAKKAETGTASYMDVAAAAGEPTATTAPPKEDVPKSDIPAPAPPATIESAAAVKAEETDVETSAATVEEQDEEEEEGTFRVSMRLSNEMPEFLVVTSKYQEAVRFHWRSEMHIQMAFMEEPGTMDGGGCKQASKLAVSGSRHQWMIGPVYRC